MSKRDYADILRMAIKMQIAPYEKYMDEHEDDCDTSSFAFREGIVRGLEIALDKIDASMFLCERE